MPRRYQIFLSSTYLDLREERAAVIRALLRAGCFPDGMELFLAANQTQWQLIEGKIRQSDYYVVIIGARYGSITGDGISYTEKEYEFARSIGKPILGFVPIEQNYADATPRTRKKLANFSQRVRNGAGAYYTSAQHLGELVSESVALAIRTNPQRGWIEAPDDWADSSRDDEIENLRRELAHLKAQLHYRQHTSIDPAVSERQSVSNIYEKEGLLWVHPTLPQAEILGMLRTAATVRVLSTWTGAPNTIAPALAQAAAAGRQVRVMLLDPASIHATLRGAEVPLDTPGEAEMSIRNELSQLAQEVNSLAGAEPNLQVRLLAVHPGMCLFAGDNDRMVSVFTYKRWVVNNPFLQIVGDPVGERSDMMLASMVDKHFEKLWTDPLASHPTRLNGRTFEPVDESGS